MKKSHLFCIATGAFVSALSLPALSQDKPEITLVAPGHALSIDPSVSTAFLNLSIAEGLVDADANAVLKPSLATEWNVSEDRLTWHFSMREGVVFHDGTTMDAEAAAAALRRAESLPGSLANAPIRSITAQGGDVVFVLDQPFAALPALLASSSAVIFAPASFNADGDVERVIATGPFRLTSIAPPQSIDGIRFDDYWGAPANIGSFRYISTGRGETRALMAESGDAEIVHTIDPVSYGRLGAIDGVTTASIPTPRVTLVKLNLDHPFLAEREARQALSLSMDRAGIAAGIVRTPGAGATQVFPPVLAAWNSETVEPLETDVEKARALLASIGWEPGEDGILMRDGARFALTMRTYPDRPELPLIAAALQDQWKAIGIDLSVSVSSYTEIPAGHIDGSLELALYARNFALIPDPIGTLLQDFGEKGGEWGAMNWARGDVSDALNRIASIADYPERGADIELVSTALQEDLPVIPVFWQQFTVAYSDRLVDFVIDPLERNFGLAQIKFAE